MKHYIEMKITIYKRRTRFVLNVRQQDYNDVPYGKGLYFYFIFIQARKGSFREKWNISHLFPTIYVYKYSSCSDSHCLTPQYIILYFRFGKCKLLGYFHPEDPFSCSLHSPCHLSPLFLFCYAKHNLITCYSTGFMAFSIMPFHLSVLLSICASYQSLLQTVEFSSKHLHALSLTWQWPTDTL